MQKIKKVAMWAFAAFCAVTLCFAVSMTLKTNRDGGALLEESIRGQLLSICDAAQDIIDLDAFSRYRDASATEDPAYVQTLEQLRALAKSAGADYIYALKRLNGQYVFVFDTDTEDPEVFIEYELSPVHEAAFLGKKAADMMNVDDEYGSFNTGAIPLRDKNDRVIGILCADIKDHLISSYVSTSRLNSILLIAGLAVTLLIMGIFIFRLLSRVHKMQDTLERMAHFDKLTNLPNRAYLMEYLQDLTTKKGKAPFALFFIDLDNFKQVNDKAGHDAGDALLRNIGEYLQNAQRNSKVFRPTAGSLNVAARIGGDEFLLVTPDLASAEAAGAFAQELIDNFFQCNIDKNIEKYKVGLSIGVALFPEHSENFHVLIKYADLAMYEAKRGGKNCYRVYCDEMIQGLPEA